MFDPRRGATLRVVFGPEFYARQFEYNPRARGLFAVGTGFGAVVIADSIEGTVHAVHSDMSGLSSMVLGLSWLNRNPHKLLVGHDSGSLRLFDVSSAAAAEGGGASQRPISAGLDAADVVSYPRFPRLTNVHANCEDTHFAVSGYTVDIGIYSLETGQRSRTLHDAHDRHINVLKFAHRDPNLLVSSSFDHTVKMWDLRAPGPPVYTCRSGTSTVMACFSEDDRYVLASGVDNDIRQYLAADGALCLRYAIPRTHSSQNYTRAYYMDGGAYMVTGSCKEPVVRVCSTLTGKILAEVDVSTFAGAGSDLSDAYIQSLRGNPNKPLSFTVLAVSGQAMVYNIIAVDLIERWDSSAFALSVVGA
jgi:WD40 repeat protein